MFYPSKWACMYLSVLCSVIIANNVLATSWPGVAHRDGAGKAKDVEPH